MQPGAHKASVVLLASFPNLLCILTHFSVNDSSPSFGALDTAWGERGTVPPPLLTTSRSQCRLVGLLPGSGRPRPAPTPVSTTEAPPPPAEEDTEAPPPPPSPLWDCARSAALGTEDRKAAEAATVATTAFTTPPLAEMLLQVAVPRDVPPLKLLGRRGGGGEPPATVPTHTAPVRPAAAVAVAAVAAHVGGATRAPVAAACPALGAEGARLLVGDCRVQSPGLADMESGIRIGCACAACACACTAVPTPAEGPATDSRSGSGGATSAEEEAEDMLPGQEVESSPLPDEAPLGPKSANNGPPPKGTLNVPGQDGENRPPKVGAPMLLPGSGTPKFGGCGDAEADPGAECVAEAKGPAVKETPGGVTRPWCVTGGGQAARGERIGELRPRSMLPVAAEAATTKTSAAPPGTGLKARGNRRPPPAGSNGPAANNVADTGPPTEEVVPGTTVGGGEPSAGLVTLRDRGAKATEVADGGCTKKAGLHVVTSITMLEQALLLPRGDTGNIPNKAGGPHDPCGGVETICPSMPTTRLLGVTGWYDVVVLRADIALASPGVWSPKTPSTEVRRGPWPLLRQEAAAGGGAPGVHVELLLLATEKNCICMARVKRQSMPELLRMSSHFFLGDIDGADVVRCICQDSSDALGIEGATAGAARAEPLAPP